MHRSLILGAAAAACLAGVVVPGTAGASQSSHQLERAASTGKVQARYTAIPYQGTTAQLRRATAGVPLFSHTVVSGGKSFTYRQVGKDPFVKQSSPTSTVAVKVIPLKVKFSNRTFDPTSTSCSTGGSPAALLANSPLEKTRAYTVGGTAVGTDQYTGFDRRAEYFSQVKSSGLNPGYHLNLSFTQLAPATATVTGSISTSCSAFAQITFSSMDSFIRNTLIPSYGAQITANTFPLVLLTNVVLTSGGCCILGYHSAYSHNGTQTYGVGEFDTNKQFTGVRDISALSHELAEWMDDPLVNNATPPWGHIGQVSGCQSNLENGDPLSGTIVPITMNGFTYHPQELAFSSWFYPGSTNTGVNGWFSSNGKFRSAAAHCT